MQILSFAYHCFAKLYNLIAFHFVPFVIIFQYTCVPISVYYRVFWYSCCVK